MSSSSLTPNLAALPIDATMPPLSLCDQYEQNSRGLYRYLIIRAGGDRHVADELMQQIWIACRSATQQFHPEPAAWLWSVARNQLAAHRRRQTSRPTHVPIENPAAAAELAARMSESDFPDALAQRRELQDQLMLALTELPGDAQDLLIDHYFHGVTHDALAGRLGVGVRAVEGRLYRARQQLRERLAPFESEER